MKMKFVIRRVIASIALTPMIAGAYVLGYATLIGLGSAPTTDVTGAWANGLALGFAVSVVLIFWEKIETLMNGQK